MTLDKIQKVLPAVVIEEMDAMSEDSLVKGVTASETAIADAKEELEANPKYQDAKQNVKAISQGFRELKKYQTAKIQYSLIRLKELGK